VYIRTITDVAKHPPSQLYLLLHHWTRKEIKKKQPTNQPGPPQFLLYWHHKQPELTKIVYFNNQILLHSQVAGDDQTLTWAAVRAGSSYPPVKAQSCSASCPFLGGSPLCGHQAGTTTLQRRRPLRAGSAELSSLRATASWPRPPDPHISVSDCRNWNSERSVQVSPSKLGREHTWWVGAGSPA